VYYELELLCRASTSSSEVWSGGASRMNSGRRKRLDGTLDDASSASMVCRWTSGFIQPGLLNCSKLQQAHTQPFNGPLTTRVSQYQKGKINLDFTAARDSEWQWHQLGRMQVCTSLQTDNMPAPYHLVFCRDALPAAQPTVSKHWRQYALKAIALKAMVTIYNH